MDQDLGQHGCGRRFAVGAADSDRILISLHQLAQELGPGQVGDSQFLYGPVFRIIGMDGGGENDKVDRRGDIFPFLSDHDRDPVGYQFLCNGGSCPVGSGYGKASAAEDLRQSAHGYAADAGKEYMNRFIEIYLKHSASREAF